MGSGLVVLIVILYSTADGSTRVEISPPMSLDKCTERKSEEVEVPPNYRLIGVHCQTVRPKEITG